MFLRLVTSLAAIALIGAAPPPPAVCGMAESFKQPDDNGARTTAVWRDPAGTAFLFGDALHVNTDGTKRSYKVGDFWGKTDALNNLCNAMSDACAGLSAAQLTARRVATERARAAGWPVAMLAATRISPAIIPMRLVDGRRIPCAEIDGYLLSATALQNPRVADACSVDRYIDALSVAAVVIPKQGGFIDRGVKVGDLAVAMKPDGSVFYAVVGDTGPTRELGEVSVALAGALLGKTSAPRNYDEIRGRGAWVGRGWDVPRTFVLILARTRDTANPYIDRGRIAAAAKAALDGWGGVDRLRACAAVYRRN